MRDDLEPARSPCSVHQHVRSPGRVNHRGGSQARDLRIGECAIRGGERARPRDDVVDRHDERGPWSSRLAEEGARRVREVDVRGPDGIASFDKPVRDVFVGEGGGQESCIATDTDRPAVDHTGDGERPCPAGGFRHGGDLAHGWPPLAGNNL